MYGIDKLNDPYKRRFVWMRKKTQDDHTIYFIVLIRFKMLNMPELAIDKEHRIIKTKGKKLHHICTSFLTKLTMKI